MKIGTNELIVITIVFLILSIGLAFIPANIVNKKGYSKGGFFVFGFFLWLPALIVALCLKDTSKPVVTTVSMADELSKYKSLLEQGIITQAEFEDKKRQILGS